MGQSNQNWKRRDVLKSLGMAAMGTTLAKNSYPENNVKEINSTLGKQDNRKLAEPVKVIVIGAGNRGWGAYSSYGLKFPDKMQVVGVAEPIPYRRERISKAFKIPTENQFETWEEVFKVPKFADALFITTPDNLHYGPAMAGLKIGYELLLEKVIAQSWKECNDILKLAEEKDAIVAICLVKRFNPYFMKMKELISSSETGKVISIQHFDSVEHIRFSHSFVRGSRANSKKSSPLILSESCDDTDILHWIVDRPCTRVQSFGSLRYFREEMAPKGSTDLCTNGCKVERTCPYSARKIYLEQRLWLDDLKIEEANNENILRELFTGPFGRCVYRCDNDVVDHQIANFEFEGDLTANFSLEALSGFSGRRTRIFCTDGDITGDEKTLTVNKFSTGEQTIWNAPDEPDEENNGEAHALIHNFVRAVAFKDPKLVVTIQESVASHLMGFKAEDSRLKGTIEKVGM